MSKRDRPPTLADIAAHGGVSLSTVSYVISGKRSISEATRQRVLQSIEELDWRPNTRARALASGATHALALLLPSPHHRLRTEHHTFVAGAAQATSESDYSLVLSTSSSGTARVSQLVDERRVDGLILMEIAVRDRRVERLRADGYAFSVIGHPDDSEGISYVDVDFDFSVRAAVAYLAELGHRDVVLFNETPSGSADKRYPYGPASRASIAFSSIVDELELDGHEVTTKRDHDHTYDAAQAAIAKLHPTAAVAVGAAGPAVAAAARDKGLRIPDDFSLIGFLPPQLAEPLALTNIDFPAFEMGRLGAEMLINRLAGEEDPPTQRLLRPPLSVRRTTGAPRRRRRRTRSS
jgi:DNA-binding LacI/PurR family transcriptional regulator